MIRPPSPLLALLWKESCQIAPLFIGAMGLGSILFLIIAMLDTPNNYDTPYGIIAIVLPNLFALGAPAMLIGHEQDTGTLAWSRTLPITWSLSFLTKWFVALAGLVLTWCASLAAYYALSSSFRDGGILEFNNQPVYFLMFSLAMLALGFCLAWWIRHAVPALLCLVPCMAFISIAIDVLASRIGGSSIATTRYSELPLGVFSLICFAVSAWLARRTWMHPWTKKRPWKEAKPMPVMRAYYPADIVPPFPPDPRIAMIWQQVRQSLPYTLTAGAIVFLATLTLLPNGISLNGSLSPLFAIGTVAATLLLGVSVFITDNTKGRYRFFADRGIPIWRIWWTRQFFPLVLQCTLIAWTAVLVWSLSPTFRPGEYMPIFFALVSVQIAGFVIGQLTALSVQRPIIAILLAPVSLGIAMFLTGFLLSIYGYRYSIHLLGAFAVLTWWLATLRLTRRWTEGNRTWGYYGRAMGWIAGGLLICFGGFFGMRWITMPSAQPKWEAQMAAQVQTLPPAGNTYVVGGFQQATQGMRSEPLRQIIENQDAVWSTGLNSGHNFNSLFQFTLNPDGSWRKLPPTLKAHYHDTMEACFLIVARQRASQLMPACASADEIESILARELSGPNASRNLREEDLQSFRARLASTDERQSARRAAILRTWQLIEEDYQAGPKDNFNFSIQTPKHVLGIERLRTQRFLEHYMHTCYTTLHDLSPQGQLQRDLAWRRLAKEEYPHNQWMSSAWHSYWTEANDQFIQRAKSMR